MPVTVRGKLIAGFTVMCLLVSGIGAYASYAIAKAGNVVIDTYDRPLMAINFARSASLNFSRMDAELLRQDFYDRPARPQSLNLSAFNELESAFLGDLRIVEERALTERSQREVEEVRDRFTAWSEDVHALNAGKVVPPQSLAVTADEIIEALDVIVELQTNASFLERENAVAAIDRSRRLGIIATMAALLVSVLVIVALGRSIIMPLNAAARAARRIAGGDWRAEIPKGGQDETGALLRSMIVMQESIRQTMNRETELRKSAQVRLAEALENASEAVVLTGPDGRIALANARLKTFFPELGGACLDGRGYNQLFDDRNVPHGLLVADEDSFQDELKLPDNRWLRVARHTTREGGAYITWTDITHAKTREAAYRGAKKRAEAASEAKSNFMRAMTHELRTPLNAIIGFSSILTRNSSTTSEEERVSFAKLIEQSGQSLLAIIENVLALSGANEMQLQPEPSDLGGLIRESVEAHRHGMEKKGLIYREEVGVEAWVEADPGALRRSLSEIIANAVKFTEAGEIAVSVRGDAQSGFETEIRDTGIGMEADSIPVALEPFQQLEMGMARQHDGCGLGLALAKKLIDQSGGTLTIQSAPGEGTAVRIWLPPAKTTCQDSEAA